MTTKTESEILRLWDSGYSSQKIREITQFSELAIQNTLSMFAGMNERREHEKAVKAASNNLADAINAHRKVA